MIYCLERREQKVCGYKLRKQKKGLALKSVPIMHLTIANVFSFEFFRYLIPPTSNMVNLNIYPGSFICSCWKGQEPF